MPQLTKEQFISGPNVIEYSTEGFAKSELQDPAIMTWLIEWLFRNDHHRDKQHARQFLKGTARDRDRSWDEAMRQRRT
jgi:hypothetical protein